MSMLGTVGAMIFASGTVLAVVAVVAVVGQILTRMTRRRD